MPIILPDVRNVSALRLLLPVFIAVSFVILLVGSGGKSTAPASAATWTWMNGRSLANPQGIYGTKDIAAVTNTPSGREFGVSWVDTSGNFWLFGGDGVGLDGNGGELNTLWRVQP